MKDIQKQEEQRHNTEQRLVTNPGVFLRTRALSTIICSRESPSQGNGDSYFLQLFRGTCVPFTLRVSKESLGTLDPGAPSGFSLLDPFSLGL